MRRRLHVVFLLILVLSACTDIDSPNQVCPAWAGYSKEYRCDIHIYNDTVSDNHTYDMTSWDKIKVIAIQDNTLIDTATNVIVSTDTGETIDYTSEFIKPGTFIVSKVDLSKPASFRLVITKQVASTVSIGTESVRVLK